MRIHKRKDGKCATFDNTSINYAFCASLYDPHLYLPVPGLPEDVGNVVMVYTGRTENLGMMRPFAQLFKMHYNYGLFYDERDEKRATVDESVNNFESDRLADIYMRTMKRKLTEHNIKQNGLYLIKVRESNNANEIKTSEYCSKFYFIFFI